MQIFHPPGSVRSLPPENVFYVADASGQTFGEGYLIPACHPDLFPERPLNIFLNLNCDGQGRDMLMGALLARAQQIREQLPGMKSRVFTQVAPDDGARLAFFEESGFDRTDALDVVRIGGTSARPAAPMGFDMGFVPTGSPGEIQGLLGRVNAYRLNAWSPALLQKYMSFPHFFALYISRGRTIVGEAVFTGSGASAKLVGLYVIPEFRGQGMAQCLIAAGMKRLFERGVTAVDADVIRRCTLQRRLAEACGATFVRTACCYPGIDYDA